MRLAMALRPDVTTCWVMGELATARLASTIWW